MTDEGPRPVLRGLRIADPPERWQALGFSVQDEKLALEEVTVALGDPGTGQRGIVSWGVGGIDPVGSIDGLATEVPGRSTAPVSQHTNGALRIDHVVVTTPDFERTSAALAEVGLGLRRIRELPGGMRQGFRRLGQPILELVQESSGDRSGPARFWGLVVVVSDLDALAELLAPHLAQVKAAVQPGRRIATLRASAGLSPAVAFMSPEP